MASTIVQVLLATAQALALLMCVAFITYVVVIIRPYLRERPKVPGDASTLSWHLFVPALNEERVVGQTIDYLRATFPQADVWVIDDASDDKTAAVVTWWARQDSFVHLISRQLPRARTGKGEALNDAYRALNAWLPSRADRGRTIIGVIDADGRPAANCLDVCAGDHLFGAKKVGSVQVMVRMLNRADRHSRPDKGRFINFVGYVLNRLQDLEFRVPIAAIQITRRFTGTVGLGGNGQFSRLSALDVVADEQGRPWRGALLDDYELSLHLMLSGHRNEFTKDTYVDQEALPDLRRFVRQRTRWSQGTMQCGSYLSQLWTSPHVSVIGALEATYYLAQPWLQLVGTFVYPLPIIFFLANYLINPAAMGTWVAAGGWLAVLYYLVGGLGPFVIWGPLYKRRCEPNLTVLQSLGFGLAYAGYTFIFYITSWRAFIRILLKRQEWLKTRRNAEFIGDFKIALPGAVTGLKEMMGDNQ